MTRAEIEKYISETYGVDADYPWESSPTFAVFRHANNKKWFALIMNIPRKSLGLSGEGSIDVMNVKCDPISVGSFRCERGVYPAYHMSKAHWLTVALDGSADDEMIKQLLGISCELTASRPKRRKAPSL